VLALCVKAVENKHAEQTRTFLTLFQMQPLFVGQLCPFLRHFMNVFLHKVHEIPPSVKRPPSWQPLSVVHSECRSESRRKSKALGFARIE
jgi:hypothetical protein